MLLPVPWVWHSNDVLLSIFFYPLPFHTFGQEFHLMVMIFLSDYLYNSFLFHIFATASARCGRDVLCVGWKAAVKRVQTKDFFLYAER